MIYYIDYDKALKKGLEMNVQISPVPPVVKNDGPFGDLGIDLFAAYNFKVGAFEQFVADTFVSFDMPEEVGGLIWPRGGDKFLVGSGVIDTGYTGTVKVRIINPFPEVMFFNAGDSIGQMVLFLKPFKDGIKLKQDEVRGATSTSRGESGRINIGVD